jgi:guanidinobutyrase / D-arginase
MTEPVPRIISGGTVGPVDATKVPRYAGEATFARLPRLDEVDEADVAIVGVPFDSGVSYRPGARFGPSHIRESSRLLRPYNPALQVPVFAGQQVADAGDLAVNPFSIDEAITAVERGARALLERAPFVLTLGGDHTIALPVLRAVSAVHGPVAVVHFDAHLDTWDTYFGAAYTHGTPFRRAAEEDLLDRTGCLHAGIRGPLYTGADLAEDAELGFQVISSPEVEHIGVRGLAERIAARVGDRPVYVSVDIDVLDPAHAPGTGTPEAGGLTSRPPVLLGPQPGRRRHRGSRPGLRPRADHRHRRRPRRVRAPVRPGRPPGLGSELDLDDLGHRDDPVAFVGQRLPPRVGHELIDRPLRRELQRLDLQRLDLQRVVVTAVPGPLDDPAAVLGGDAEDLVLVRDKAALRAGLGPQQHAERDRSLG